MLFVDILILVSISHYSSLSQLHKLSHVTSQSQTIVFLSHIYTRCSMHYIHQYERIGLID